MRSGVVVGFNLDEVYVNEALGFRTLHSSSTEDCLGGRLTRTLSSTHLDTIADYPMGR